MWLTTAAMSWVSKVSKNVSVFFYVIEKTPDVLAITNRSCYSYDFACFILSVFPLFLLNCEERFKDILLRDIVLVQSWLHSLVAILISENNHHDKASAPVTLSRVTHVHCVMSRSLRHMLTPHMLTLWHLTIIVTKIPTQVQYSRDLCVGTSDPRVYLGNRENQEK